MLIPAPLLALLTRYLRFDAADPAWPDRDRLVGGAVHAPMLTELASAIGAGPALFQDIAGPPGLAFGAALGMALGERMLAARFGRSLVDHRTWLLTTDDELQTGMAMEAAALAGTLAMSRLCVLVELPPESRATASRFTAKGWTVRRIATPDDVGAAFSAVQRAQKPTLLVWPRGLREVTDAASLARAGARGATARRAWLKRLARHAARDAFNAALALALPAGVLAALTEPTDTARPASTAETLRRAWPRLAQTLPELAGLPLDDPSPLPPGRAFPWGPQHQAQAGALLGMALHGGIRPLGQIAWDAQDFAGPALREAGGQKLLLVLEEGADCGQSALWQAMPGVTVFRPADPAEALHCLALALRPNAGAAIFLVSRQPAATLPNVTRAAVAGGAWRVTDPPAPDVTLLASGPELRHALAVAAILTQGGCQPCVISVPVMRFFTATGAQAMRDFLGPAPCFALDAGPGTAWAAMLGPTGQLMNVGAAEDPARLAARILRCLTRSPAILEGPDNVLENGGGID